MDHMVNKGPIFVFGRAESMPLFRSKKRHANRVSEQKRPSPRRSQLQSRLWRQVNKWTLAFGARPPGPELAQWSHMRRAVGSQASLVGVSLWRSGGGGQCPSHWQREASTVVVSSLNTALVRRFLRPLSVGLQEDVCALHPTMKPDSRVTITSLLCAPQCTHNTTEQTLYHVTVPPAEIKHCKAQTDMLRTCTSRMTSCSSCSLLQGSKHHRYALQALEPFPSRPPASSHRPLAKKWPAPRCLVETHFKARG